MSFNIADESSLQQYLKVLYSQIADGAFQLGSGLSVKVLNFNNLQIVNVVTTAVSKYR